MKTFVVLFQGEIEVEAENKADAIRNARMELDCDVHIPVAICLDDEE